MKGRPSGLFSLNCSLRAEELFLLLNRFTVSRYLYDLFIFLQTTAFRLAGLWNVKASQWWAGRRNWRTRLSAQLPENETRLWVHAASLGEFEQSRPLIERLKKDYPGYTIVLTFFSPSGFTARQQEKLVDHVFYLPVDTARNAREFIQLVQPRLVFIIKYEFWHHYLDTLYRLKIPTFLVSAAFMPDHAFFRWYGSFFRKMLRAFTCIFVQDTFNAELLASIGVTQNVVVAGDTRYDRVAALVRSSRKIPEVERFKGECRLLIGGSTWPKDESLLHACLSGLPADWKLVIAPHEIDEGHIRDLSALFGDEAVLFSSLPANPSLHHKRVLIFDTMGLLSSLYAYGTLAFIGGGFKHRGLHNILEPAAYGNLVLFGPEYTNFMEAISLVKQQLAFPVKNETEASALIRHWIENPALREQKASALQTFLLAKTGATDRIIEALIQSQHLPSKML